MVRCVDTIGHLQVHVQSFATPASSVGTPSCLVASRMGRCSPSRIRFLDIDLELPDRLFHDRRRNGVFLLQGV